MKKLRFLLLVLLGLGLNQPICDVRAAIPLDVILDTFTDTLNLERYSNLFQAQNIRRATLTVDPGTEANGETTFKTIKDALAKAQWGDTFKLAAGTFTLTEKLQIPAGCRFIGAGHRVGGAHRSQG